MPTSLAKIYFLFKSLVSKEIFYAFYMELFTLAILHQIYINYWQMEWILKSALLFSHAASQSRSHALSPACPPVCSYWAVRCSLWLESCVSLQLLWPLHLSMLCHLSSAGWLTACLCVGRDLSQGGWQDSQVFCHWATSTYTSVFTYSSLWSKNSSKFWRVSSDSKRIWVKPSQRNKNSEFFG